MKYLLVSFCVLLLFVLSPVAAMGAIETIDIVVEEIVVEDEVPTREALTDTLIRDKFFRSPRAVLWTYFGEDANSYAIQIRHGFITTDILPSPLDQLGLMPSAAVGDIIYESNPSGEEGDAIWSRATIFYDNLFDFDFLEGRVIYQDIKLDSYLGAGIGFAPIHNSWIGGYYLGSEGFMISGEIAKALGEQFRFYATAQY